MFNVLLEVIFPVFFIFSLGFIGQKRLKLDIKAVSSVVIYIMMPTLVFRTFYKTDLNLQYLYMVLFTFLLFYTIVLIIKIISKIKKYSSSIENGLILASGFMNSGNYGAPVSLIAFGDVGFVYAISFAMLQNIFMNSFGVFFAAKGNTNFLTTMKAVLKIPSIYTFLLALVWNYSKAPMPESFFSVIDLLAGATIPTIMLILGMQLSQISITGINLQRVSIGVIIRLIISPLIAWIITMWLPLDPLLEKVLIVSSAMPTAATTTMLSLQYDTEPELVSSITLIATILSSITLSILLAFLI